MKLGQYYNISNVSHEGIQWDKLFNLDQTQHNKCSQQANTKPTRWCSRQQTTNEVTIPTRWGTLYAQCYLSCNMCQDTSRVIDSDRKISKCSECGLMQQKSQCSTQVMTSILTITDEETMSFNIFDDIKKEQDADCRSHWRHNRTYSHSWGNSSFQ